MGSKSSNKPKRVLKSKEEILKDLQKVGDFRKKMKFTKEQFYPALIEASRSIDDAKSFISSISTIIMQEFLGMMKEKKFGELNLTKKLDEKDEKYDDLCKLLHLFDEETIFDARDTIEGMRNEISLFIDDEMRGRSLSSLKTNWIDDLPVNNK